MDIKQFRFLNATSFTVDADFLIIFEQWNDFGYTNICKIIGKNELPLNLSATFRVIDLSGAKQPHGHVLNEYSNQIFTSLPSTLKTIITDIKGCESIFICLSPSDRELLIKSLNICFPGSSSFLAVKNNDAFKKSVLRDHLLDEVISNMKKCQDLLTSPLDVHQMILENYNR
jgi:hypothetical protein